MRTGSPWRDLPEAFGEGNGVFRRFSRRSRKGDAPRADALIADLTAEVIMADAAYDSDRLRKAILDKGALAVVPDNPARAPKHPLDKDPDRPRRLVACGFAEPERFRRVAPRFGKTARNRAAIVLWLR